MKLSMKRHDSNVRQRSHLEIHDDGLDEEENGGVILPVDVGGSFTQFDAGDGGALHQLFAATLTC